VLSAAAPAAGLPKLQDEVWGHAIMGYGDLFIAGTLGAVLAADGRRQLSATALAAALGLAFNLLFFWVDDLPATVPFAVTLLLLEAYDRRGAWPFSRRTPRPSRIAPDQGASARATPR
jgi:hypothetical protein